MNDPFDDILMLTSDLLFNIDDSTFSTLNDPVYSDDSPVVARILQSISLSAKPPHLPVTHHLNLSRDTIGKWSPLSRPLVHHNTLVIGTESALSERGPGNYRDSCSIMIVDIDGEELRSGSRVVPKNSQVLALDSAVYDLQWLVPGETCVVGTESYINKVWIKDSHARSDIIRPVAEEEVIRQICVDPVGTKMAVGDQGSKRLSIWSFSASRETFSFQIGSVSSVAWHPSDENLLTFTTDDGVLGVLDYRVRDPIRVHQNYCNRTLYAHSKISGSDSSFVLGYLSGCGVLVDLRFDKPIDFWKDPILRCIGELIPSNSNIIAATGIGGTSFWDFSSGKARCLGYNTSLSEAMEVPLQKITYKTSGVFVNQNIFLQSDQAGFTSLIKIPL